MRGNLRPGWRQWLETWYVSYALLGATVAGLVPILVPLMVVKEGNPALVGLAMAAISLGGLIAPVWGSLADRLRLHRGLMVGGLGLAALALAAFPWVGSSGLIVGIALLLGSGSAGATTVANLFVVEVHPKTEWDKRIGWLQTFYGGGQAAGLFLAGILSTSGPAAGLSVAAGLVALAAIIGWRTAPFLANPSPTRPVLLHPHRPGEWSIISPGHLFHYLSTEDLKKVFATLRSPFGVFLLSWFISFGSAAVVFSFYPVLMQKVFGVAPGLSSTAFAVAAALGLLLYSPAGYWADRFGVKRVLWAGLGIRVVAFGGLLVLGWIPAIRGSWLALAAFALVVLAWSLLTVSSTSLAASLSPSGQGAGLGFFNATSALAGMVGAGVGGWVASGWGYPALLGLALGGVILGLFLFLFGI